MSVRQVYFTQDCQVCGRPMRVRLELFGKRICCAHCNASCHAGSVGSTGSENPPRRSGFSRLRGATDGTHPARGRRDVQEADTARLRDTAGLRDTPAGSRQVINPVVMRTVYRPGGGDGSSATVFLH
ncbi:hypothetical protein [Roseimaritima ulvae]|uniref:Uncharacterized protein n=1 Tax=Roseimaritima ulvae TaxID=980254 RepID=A0A5B9QGX7_9BACT|nr:hypothetical protein [Roseimaritima ulvae]QEG38357.1 hypothetical protein UC8_03140 [Roseimaritima ulvae]